MEKPVALLVKEALDEGIQKELSASVRRLALCLFTLFLNIWFAVVFLSIGYMHGIIWMKISGSIGALAGYCFFIGVILNIQGFISLKIEQRKIQKDIKNMEE